MAAGVGGQATDTVATGVCGSAEVATRDGHARAVVTTKVCDTEAAAATLFDVTDEVQQPSPLPAVKAAAARSTQRPAMVDAGTGGAGTGGHRTGGSGRGQLREGRGRDGWRWVGRGQDGQRPVSRRSSRCRRPFGTPGDRQNPVHIRWRSRQSRWQQAWGADNRHNRGGHWLQLRSPPRLARQSKSCQLSQELRIQRQ